MGYPLRREVRDLLPKGVLTDKEARLILEVADACDDDTRTGWPGVEWLADKCDIPNPKRVGEFFANIAKKWVELRVPLGHSADGRPYYSYPGENTRFRFPPRATLITLRNKKVPAKGGPKVPATGGPNPERSPQRGDLMVPALGGSKVPPLGGPISSISSSSSSSSLSPDAAGSPTVTHRERDEDSASPKPKKTAGHRAVGKLGVEGEQADFVVAWLSKRYAIEGPGWWVTAGRNGSLADAVAEALEALEESKLVSANPRISPSEHRAAVANEPDCSHGFPGGNVPKPDDGWLPCVGCRNASSGGAVIDLAERRAS